MAKKPGALEPELTAAADAALELMKQLIALSSGVLALSATFIEKGLCSRVVRALFARHGIRDVRTRPYTPRTNGKAEQVIQTLLREWAYARPYARSWLRTAALRPYLRYYNLERRHSALGHITPAARLRALSEQRP